MYCKFIVESGQDVFPLAWFVLTLLNIPMKGGRVTYLVCKQGEEREKHLSLETDLAVVTDLEEGGEALVSRSSVSKKGRALLRQLRE